MAEIHDSWRHGRGARPFATWGELEDTYHYARDHAPDVFTKTLADAQKAHKDAIKAADDIPLPGHGEIGNGREGRADNISSTFGTSELYLRRRLKRDFPDLFERVDRQELSARAAAIQAGIVKRTQSVRLDDPDSAARTLRRHMPADARRRLAELLTQEDSQP